jgi:hypothetical protein
MNKQYSNIDKINEYVQNGSPLRQVFLIDALIKVSKAVTENQEEVRKNMANSPIHPDGWIQCATDALEHWKELQGN